MDCKLFDGDVYGRAQPESVQFNPGDSPDIGELPELAAEVADYRGLSKVHVVRTGSCKKCVFVGASHALCASLACKPRERTDNQSVAFMATKPAELPGQVQL